MSPLEKMAIRPPDECRVETVIENHDSLSVSSGGLAKDDGVVVCNVGGGNTAVTLYRVTMYPQDESEVGRHPQGCSTTQAQSPRTEADGTAAGAEGFAAWAAINRRSVAPPLPDLVALLYV
jgi:hypothetical protein